MNQCKRGGVFKDTEDEALCVWGVGVANLVRHRGLLVDALPPLIPQETAGVVLRKKTNRCLTIR